MKTYFFLRLYGWRVFGRRTAGWWNKPSSLYFPLGKWSMAVGWNSQANHGPWFSVYPKPDDILRWAKNKGEQ